MTLQEHLLTIAAEECAEIAQRLSKAQRFGMDQIQRDADDQPQENPEHLTNRERIVREFYDLRAVLGMVGIDAWDASPQARAAEAAKVAKVQKYLERSRRCGTLHEESVAAAGSAPEATP